MVSKILDMINGTIDCRYNCWYSDKAIVLDPIVGYNRISKDYYEFYIIRYDYLNNVYTLGDSYDNSIQVFIDFINISSLEYKNDKYVWLIAKKINNDIDVYNCVVSTPYSIFLDCKSDDVSLLLDMNYPMMSNINKTMAGFITNINDAYVKLLESSLLSKNENIATGFLSYSKFIESVSELIKNDVKVDYDLKNIFFKSIDNVINNKSDTVLNFSIGNDSKLFNIVKPNDKSSIFIDCRIKQGYFNFVINHDINYIELIK